MRILVAQSASGHAEAIVNSLRSEGHVVDLVEDIRRLAEAPVDDEVDAVVAPQGERLQELVAQSLPEAEVIQTADGVHLELSIVEIVRHLEERNRLLEENRRLVGSLKRYAKELEVFSTSLREVTDHDALTGLYNHRYFVDAFETELSRARRHRRPFAVMLLEVDHFRQYNHDNGHAAGDLLLQKIARIIQDASRRSTTFARFSAARFVGLLPETDPAGARAAAAKYRKLIADAALPAEVGTAGACVTISAGGAAYPAEGVGLDELIGLADDALVSSRSAG